MSTAMERYQAPLDLIESIDDLARLSKQVAESNYYGDTRSAQQAAVKLMIARELGLGITAISNVHLVDGKIQLGYQILIALVKRSGKYNMRFVERTDTCVRIEWFEDGESVGFSKFDMEDAKRADLVKPSRNGSPSNFMKYPIRMLTARAVSDGFSTYAPECAGGALYTDGEISNVEVEPEPAPRRKRERSAAPPIASPPPEEIVDAEVVVDAPGDVTPVESQRATEQPEAEPASTTTSNPDWNDVKAAKVMLASLSEDEKEAVYEACDQLEIKRTVNALVERFGSMTAKRETFLPAIAAAVNPPEKIDGEVGNGSAAAFDEFIAEDTAAQSIARAEESRARTSAKLAAAGEFGS